MKHACASVAKLRSSVSCPHLSCAKVIFLWISMRRAADCCVYQWSDTSLCHRSVPDSTPAAASAGGSAAGGTASERLRESWGESGAMAGGADTGPLATSKSRGMAAASRAEAGKHCLRMSVCRHSCRTCSLCNSHTCVCRSRCLASPKQRTSSALQPSVTPAAGTLSLRTRR